jgi:hypothetical protein
MVAGVVGLAIHSTGAGDARQSFRLAPPRYLFENALARLRPNLPKAAAERRATGDNSCTAAYPSRFEDTRHFALNKRLQKVALRLFQQFSLPVAQPMAATTSYVWHGYGRQNVTVITVVSMRCELSCEWPLDPTV